MAHYYNTNDETFDSVSNTTMRLEQYIAAHGVFVNEALVTITAVGLKHTVYLMFCEKRSHDPTSRGHAKAAKFAKAAKGTEGSG